MALRQAIKISRYLLHHKHKLLPSAYPLSTKPSKLFQFNPSCSETASSYSDNATLKLKKVSKKTSGRVKESEVPKQNVILEPSLEPVIDQTVKKEFVKSSTQNALTMPLKMPRLANPFPEPVKCQQSHTVSDAEKARIMLEEVKMETKYGLYHKQKTIMKQNYKPINYTTPCEQTRSNFTQKKSRRPQTSDQDYNNDFDNQPNYRRAKNYEQLQEEHLSSNHPQKSHQKIVTESNEKCETNDEPKREGRRKTRTRAPRYLRNLWKQRDQQTRKYSTFSKNLQNEPNAMTEVEQCEKILERVKAMHPELYGHLKKPFCVPGSPEEQAFIKNTLLLGRRTTERNQDNGTRQSAPIPSYSEVKTLARPNIQLDSVYSVNNANSVDTSRNYSTKNDRFGANADNYNFLERSKLSESLNRSNCNYGSIMENDVSQFYNRQERNNYEDRMPAPYPSYSECVENPDDKEDNEKETQYEEDKMSTKKHDLFGKRRSKDDIKNRSYSTYTTAQQKSVDTNLKQKYSTLFKQTFRNGKNNFGTSIGSLNSNRLNSNPDKNKEIEFIKKKKPCENPYSDLPICDYEEARKIRDHKRKKPKKNSDKKKKCSANESDTEPSETSLDITKEKTKNVIKRIRNWLSSWRPESENIRVSKFYTDIDGRDTYVIQIDEYEEIEKQRKTPIETKEEEEIISQNVMEEKIVMKECEQVQQPNKIQPKTLAKKIELDEYIPPIAVINKLNKKTKMQESETFKIKEKEFIPAPIKNKHTNNMDFNLPTEEMNIALYLDKEKKKNPCNQKKKEKKPKCRQIIKKKLPSCADVPQEKLDERPENIIPLVTKNTPSRTKQLLKKFSFTSSNKKQSTIDIKPQEIGIIHHEMTENKTKNREMPFKLKQEFWK